MTPPELLAAFETLADAPDGVERLRELVLQMAVRGKLVPQNPAEGSFPPSELPLPLDEAPFSLPEQWAWRRLPEVAAYSVGKTPPTKESRFWGLNQIPWVSIADMPDGGIVRTTARTITADAVKEVFRKPIIPAGTLLMSFKLTIGKIALLGIEAYHNEAIISLTPAANVSRDYLFRVLPLRAIGGESRDAIMGATLNSQSLARILIPLPPLAEQRRIVARLEELMDFLDRLEAAQTARDERRHAARDAALAALRDAENTEALDAAWSRVSSHMDALFTAPEDVTLLRQAVLQLGVRGRLAPQDPNDEPAAMLSERSRAIEARLTSAGQIAKRKRLAPVAEHEQNFAVPPGWEWRRIDDLFDVVGGIQKSGKRTPHKNPVPYLRVANVQRGRVDLSDVLLFEVFEGELERCRLRAGDLLIVEGNGSENEIGRCARWSGEIEPCIHQNHIIRLRPFIETVELFAIRHLNSPDGTAIMKKLAVTTSGLYNLSVGKIRSIAIPVPPLAEQQRIVMKVDRLLALCDDLENRLTATRELQAQFAAAAVHHLDM